MPPEPRTKKGGQNCPGEIRSIYSPKTGELLSIEAYAGRFRGNKLRRRFKISHYESEKWARKAALEWLRTAREDKVEKHQIFLNLPERDREDFLEAIELLKPYHLRVPEAIRTYVLPSLGNKSADPWTFRQAANAVLEFKRFNKKSPHYLRGLKGYLSTICLS